MQNQYWWEAKCRYLAFALDESGTTGAKSYRKVAGCEVFGSFMEREGKIEDGLLGIFRINRMLNARDEEVEDERMDENVL